MSHLKTCTLIGSDKGGVGKSLIAQLFVLAHDKAGLDLSVIEVDHQRKLTSILKNRVDLALDATPSIAFSTRDRFAVEGFFNTVYEKWVEQDSLTDLGANVTTSIMEWARVNQIAGLAEEDNIHFRFVAVTTPDDQAIRSAIAAVEEARRGLGADAEIFVILNNNSSDSGFEPYEGTDDWRRLMGLRHTHGVQLIRVPHCDSKILEWGKGLGLTVLDILQNERGEIARIQQQAQLDRITLRTHARRLTEWVQALQEGLAPLFQEPQRGVYREAAE